MRLHEHYLYLVEQINEIERELDTIAKKEDTTLRLMTIPSIGPITASALMAHLGNGQQYKKGRDFAAATGLVPRQYSTGGRATLLGISKRGDKHLRRLLVQCARVFILRLEHQSGALADWVKRQLTQKHSCIVACALANKLARIAWAITAKQTVFQA